jgi:hypothetical protein
MFGFRPFSPWQSPQFLFWLAPLVIWDLFWRGKALWKAAQKRELYWFIALLLINSVGILPILYLAFFAKKDKN